MKSDETPLTITRLNKKPKMLIWPPKTDQHPVQAIL